MLVISTGEFRQNLKMYLEKADQGEKIIVQRGKNKSYHLNPVNEDDMYFNAEMMARIEESIQQIKEGKSLTVSTPAEIKKLLGL
jgi:PHD/YefM family antitoxin component YafN of YafNO toxin-antitoxin module